MAVSDDQNTAPGGTLVPSSRPCEGDLQAGRLAFAAYGWKSALSNQILERARC